MGFSRNAIGDSVSWLPDVTIAAYFRGGFEPGKSVSPIAVILGFRQKPFGTERVKETCQIGLKTESFKIQTRDIQKCGVKMDERALAVKNGQAG